MPAPTDQDTMNNDNNDNSSGQPFLQQLAELNDLAYMGTDDLLGLVLPLLEQVAELHGMGQVAPLDGIDTLRVSLGHIWFKNSDAKEPADNSRAIKILAKAQPQSRLDITGSYAETRSADGSSVSNKSVAKREETEARVAYYADYLAWEEKLNHHDALTDIYVLGLVMGSLAIHADLTQANELENFVSTRHDVSMVNERIHPVVAQLIAQMTELDRAQRPQDLHTVVQALQHYREQDIDKQNDDEILSQHIEGDSKRHAIQAHLRNKLFELSRRNRLLYFRETSSTANLTLGSVPHVLDYRSIRLEQLLLANNYLCQKLSSSDATPLSRWLRFEDYPYLSGSLNKIRLQARRDQNEYGFSQLRIVLVFLRWYNLKEAPDERINSPLILVPVSVQKKKGVKDSFTLSADMSNAEINPVLRHHLKQLYNINLPERINAENIDAVTALHNDLSQQIARSAKGVELKLIETPRIKLIASKAKRKLDDYKRKVRITGKGVSQYEGLSYSYAKTKYEPLGVQIFERNVRPTVAPARDIFDEQSTGSVFNAMASAPTEATVERDFYSIDQVGKTSSNIWEFDLCSVTLANFNYRKMTLVRDYSELLSANDIPGQNFDTLFSEHAKQLLPELKPTAVSQQYHVLPADPSQSESVLRSRSGQSYVIQGPPGTGKSQTITNLIVDYLAQKKSVLFVCEKRVALDVVYHRLNQVGLGDLSALIHDSQGDKKAFIDDLEALYQQWLGDQALAQDDTRKKLLADIDSSLAELEQFSDAMQAPIETTAEDMGENVEQESNNIGASKHNINLRELIQHWVMMGQGKPELTTAQRAQLPSWPNFTAHKTLLNELADNLLAATGTAILADTPIWCLQGSVTDVNDPQATLNTFCQQIKQWWPDTQAAVGQLQQLLETPNASWANLLEANQLIRELLPLILDDQIKLLDGDSISALKLQKQMQQWQTLTDEAQQKQTLATGWQEGVSAEEINAALHAANDCEGKWWLFLSSRWRAAKKLVRTKGPAVTSSYAATLKLADDAFDAKQRQQQKQKDIEAQANLEDISVIAPILTRAWQDAKQHSATARQVYRACIAQKNAPDALAKIAKNSALRNTEAELSTYLTAYHQCSASDIQQAVAALQGQSSLAFDVADLLQQLDSADASLSTAIRTLPLSLAAIENAIATDTIEQKIRRNRHLNRFEGARVDILFKQLDKQLQKLRVANANYVVEVTRNQFHNNINRASGSMAGTTQEEKDWRRAFNRGRKLLEREFEKTRAYKSIRELFSSEAGELLRNLKPIWMMSPLSVSDVLPLSEQVFDVVIFDEASQIPLEDAVPALYRTRQMIVVGDEMQLPPSAFFSSQSDDEEDQPKSLHIYNLNADSFLSRSSGALPTTLLNWHYRSRHESLIGFCNQAFYNGKLQTIPSSTTPSQHAPIVIEHGSLLLPQQQKKQQEQPQEKPHEKSQENGKDTQVLPSSTLNLQRDIYTRPISYHKLENSPYHSQRNTGEANYIANVVRALLLDERDHTIGIVAFSQAQQQEIETAISRLASQDQTFANKLEAEEERTDEGQFVGLFVKNLENVQGDERDIIILSVCYGPNSKGKMHMNFGPINQNGGEKRLNVIFSRAKQHMVVVTSIEATQITNTYNTGANALRQYLRYARSVSEGNVDGMQAALLEYGYSLPEANNMDGALIQAIAQRLRAENLIVKIGYGQSSMKCHLAVRRPSDSQFTLAILTDNNQHYHTQDLINRYHTPASILQAFGWNVCHILAKDWYKDADAVVKRVNEILNDSV